MRKKLSIDLPKRKEAKNVSYKVIDGKIEVSYDLEDKFEPKDGDFCVTGNGCIFICNTSYTIGDILGFYVGISAYDKIIFNKDDKTGFSDAKRLATRQEKSAFFERLKNECGKTWNAEKKCLEDIYKPKFGDIVKVTINDINCFKRNYMICIYPDKPNIPDDDFFDIALIDMNGNYSDEETGGNYNSIITKASIEEKKELFDKLAEAGKRWNPDTKQLENIRWRAEKMKEYYCIEEYNNEVLLVYDLYVRTDNKRYESGNYFRTPEAARKVADQIKEIFKNSKAE